MTPDHERIEELLSVRALDGLEPADERELAQARAAHGPDCAECARLERETLEVAALLAFSLAPVPVDAGMAERILATHAVTIVPDEPVVEAPAPAPAAIGGVTGPTDPIDELSARRDSRSARTWAAVLGVAAVVVSIAVFTATVVRAPVEVTRADLSGRIVHFDGGVDGTLTMAYTPGTSGAVFWGHGLPDPGEGQTFEIWMIDDGVAVPGGCTSPVDGRIALFVDAEIGTTDLMAVTVEPTACPPEPTTDPVLTADLTTL
jgi:hypothetical protein